MTLPRKWRRWAIRMAHLKPLPTTPTTAVEARLALKIIQEAWSRCFNGQATSDDDYKQFRAAINTVADPIWPPDPHNTKTIFGMAHTLSQDPTFELTPNGCLQKRISDVILYDDNNDRDVNLGPFTLTLTQDHKFVVQSEIRHLKPHPHADQDGILCLGVQRQLVETCVQNGYIIEAFMLAENITRNYDGSMAHRPLVNCLHEACHCCDTLDYTTKQCPECGRWTCDDCVPRRACCKKALGLEINPPAPIPVATDMTILGRFITLMQECPCTTH